jgi:hypothetical protein
MKLVVSNFPADTIKEKIMERVIEDVVNNTTHREGKTARAIEEQTAKLPSDLFLWAGVGLLSASLVLKACKQDHLALFVGQFAAPVLLLGTYNKVVKVEGHDQES